MANWLSLANLLGTYVSSPIDISLRGGDSALTRIHWKRTVPDGCKLTIQTSVSTDQGKTWSDWMTCENDGSIPNIRIDTPLYSALLRFRVIFQSYHYSVSPVLDEISFTLEPVIVFDNKGDVNCKPEVWIEKIGNGDVSIVNTSDGNREFTFTGLVDEETVYVNNEREHIETSLTAKYRYSHFNDQYLDFPPGVNLLRVRGNAKIQFRYEFQTIQ
ncbi:hypothetical protein PAE9249_05135 [Paenibacillus sp. CECT 9249]|uniref:phage tail family protein n=1 Tax=Paenibacillus sp. CECT 9249 TaxID=2845385 RepID=UPI001E5D34E6|nr:phage tail family protein [Paenibacillus sp. CECT 9249]CAH0122563.1 hypothetical protein PAE9249_05135 [Paenibacillus sp. CECT 9249]